MKKAILTVLAGMPLLGSCGGVGPPPADASAAAPVLAPHVANRSARPLGSTAAGFGYVERLPATYGDSAAAKFPLIIYFHGTSEIGSNLAILTGNATPGTPTRDLTAMIDPDQDQGRQSFVVLFPQRQAQVVDASRIRAFIDYAVKAYKVDPARVYLLGLSAGAAQIWSYLQVHQDQVAAVVPLAGYDTTTNVCAFKEVPIWAFHAADDAVVPVSQTVSVIERLNACTPAPRARARLTVFPTGGHVIDSPTFALKTLGQGDPRYSSYAPDIYTWLLQHHR